MSDTFKYRGFFETDKGDTTALIFGREEKGEWVYSDSVEVDAPCDILVFAHLLTGDCRRIPHYTQVRLETIEKYEKGTYRPLYLQEIVDIWEEVKKNRIAYLN